MELYDVGLELLRQEEKMEEEEQVDEADEADEVDMDAAEGNTPLQSRTPQMNDVSSVRLPYPQSEHCTLVCILVAIALIHPSRVHSPPPFALPPTPSPKPSTASRVLSPRTRPGAARPTSRDTLST
jgi:hypothetical protein